MSNDTDDVIEDVYCRVCDGVANDPVPADDVDGIVCRDCRGESEQIMLSEVNEK